MTDNDTNIIIVIALVIFVGLIAAAEIGIQPDNWNYSVEGLE